MGQTPCGDNSCDDSSQTCCQTAGKCYPIGSSFCSWDICCPPGKICCPAGDRCCPDAGHHPVAVCCGTSTCCPPDRTCCNHRLGQCCLDGYCNPNGGYCCTLQRAKGCPGFLGGPFCTWSNATCCADSFCPKGLECCYAFGFSVRCPPGVGCKGPQCIDPCSRHSGEPCGSVCACPDMHTCSDDRFCCPFGEECCPGMGGLLSNRIQLLW